MSRSGAPLVRSDWSSGMVQDEPRYQIPDTALWDAVDVFIDLDGAISKRGGITTCQSATTTKTFSKVGILQSSSADAITRGYGAGATFQSFTPASGTFALTDMDYPSGGETSFLGTPFQYQNFLIFPQAWNSADGVAGTTALSVAGATGSINTFSASTAYTFTAGSPTVSGVAAGDFAHISAGMIIRGLDNATPTKYYLGRVVSTNSGAGTIQVEPVPTTGFTGATGGATTFQNGYMFGFDTLVASPQQIIGAACGCTWQNRVILGNIVNVSASQPVSHPSRVIWSILPTEVPSGGIVQGASQLHYSGYETNNFVDLPDLQQVVAVVPMQAQALLVLGTNAAALITGTLTTQTAATTIAAFTYSVQTIQQRAGCLAQASVQQSASGVVFASREGVMLFDGKHMLNLMQGRLVNYWKGLVAAGLTIQGSAILTPNHYYISTSAGGFLCNLDGFRWTRVTNADITGSAFDVASGYRCFAAALNNSASASSARLLHLEQMLLPTSSNRSDAVGSTVVTPVIKTKTDPTVLFSALGARLRSYSNPSLLKKYKHSEVTLRMVGGSATTTVTATPGLDAEETSQVALTFSPSANAQVKRAQLYNPQVISHAIGYTITTTGACDSLDLYVIETDVVPLRQSRVA